MLRVRLFNLVLLWFLIITQRIYTQLFVVNTLQQNENRLLLVGQYNAVLLDRLLQMNLHTFHYNTLVFVRRLYGVYNC